MDHARNMISEADLVSVEDAEILIYDIYRAKSIVGGRQIGQLQLVPVDPDVILNFDSWQPATHRIEQSNEELEACAAHVPPEQEIEFQLDFDNDSNDDYAPTARDKFYHKRENWILLSSGEAERIAQWYDTAARNWSGEKPLFLADIEIRKRILSQIARTSDFFCTLEDE